MSDKPKERGLQDLLAGITLNGGRGNGEPVADVLHRRPTKARRSREWERSKASITATYRGIPPEVKEAIATIAANLGINVGEVARRFLEHGLAAYRDGTLVIPVHVVAAKKTSYPDE